MTGTVTDSNGKPVADAVVIWGDLVMGNGLVDHGGSVMDYPVGRKYASELLVTTSWTFVYDNSALWVG